MKFIHLSDTHLQKDEFHLYGLDPFDRLNTAIKSINKNFKDIDFIVITGDLTHRGDTKAFRKLKKLVKKSKVEVILLLGNHDDRENFIKVFKDYPVNDGYIQDIRTIDNNAFIFLDTNIKNSHKGDMSDEQFLWFEKKLKENKDKNTYIFMHHPPMDVGIKLMDKIGFESKKGFKNLVLKYPNIKYIFFGHLHRIITGIWEDIPYFGIRGTNHQLSLKHSETFEYTTNEEKPAYAIVEIKNKNITINVHEYLDEEKCFMIEE